MIKYDISPDKTNLHLIDSYTVPTRRFDRVLNSIEALHPTLKVWERSRCSLKLEWSAHNGLYLIGLFRSHTKDCDLNCPQKLWEKLVWPVLGVIFWPFID